MRKALILVLLGIGTLAGYAHAFHSYRHHGCHDNHGGFRAPWAMDEDVATRHLDERCVSRACASATAAPPAPPTPSQE